MIREHLFHSAFFSFTPCGISNCQCQRQHFASNKDTSFCNVAYPTLALFL